MFTKLEHNRISRVGAYIEIDDMSVANDIICQMESMFGKNFRHRIIPARSGNVKHLGIDIEIDKKLKFDMLRLLELENVLYVDEE